MEFKMLVFFNVALLIRREENKSTIKGQLNVLIVKSKSD